MAQEARLGIHCIPEILAEWVAMQLVTAGAVDSLYANGVGSIGDAFSDGADAVSDTGEAVGGLAKDAWDAIF